MKPRKTAKSLDGVPDLNDVLIKISAIEENLCKTNEKLDKLMKSTEKLDQHIDFIEETYDTLKHPLKIFTRSVPKQLK